MVLGIDIGGTSVKLGLVDGDDRIAARREARVDLDGYRTPILDTAVDEAKRFLAEAGVCIEGVGVSATGQVDVHTGTVIGTNGKIPGWEGAPVGRVMEEAFSCPAVVLNDANAAVLGECAAGAAAGVANAVMVTIGTGVGGGIVTDGKLLNGKRGIAGEIGHFTLYQDGVPCECGKKGCFECYASTAALVRGCERAAGVSGLDGRRVFESVAAGDPRLLPVYSHWLDDIAAGITGLVHIFDPDMVIVGGGVSSQEELFISPLRERVLRGVMPRFAEGLRLERAMLGNDAGLIGAAIMCRERYLRPAAAADSR